MRVNDMTKMPNLKKMPNWMPILTKIENGDNIQKVALKSQKPHSEISLAIKSFEDSSFVKVKRLNNNSKISLTPKGKKMIIHITDMMQMLGLPK